LRQLAERQAYAAGSGEFCLAVAADRAGKEIHRRRADEPRHEQIARPIVEVQRCADLLDAAVMHHHNLVGHAIWSWVT
jgi:hypothetical protein